MQRARAAMLAPRADGAAEQLQNGGDGHGGTDRGKVEGGLGRWCVAACIFFGLSLARLFTAFASLGQFAVALVENRAVATFEFIFGCDVAEGRMQADVIIMANVILHEPAGLVECERHPDTDAFAFERLVPAFDLTVGLRIVG